MTPNDSQTGQRKRSDVTPMLGRKARKRKGNSPGVALLAQDTKLIETFLEYCRAMNYSPHTITSYARALRAMATYFLGHNIPLIAATRTDLRAFLASEMQSGFAPASVSQRCEVLRSFYTFLRRRHLIATNPAALLSTVKIPHRLPPVLAEAEAKAVVEAPDPTTPEGIRDGAILETFYGTGIRLAELISLQLTDVDLENMQIKVMGKGRKERIVPIGHQAAESVKRYLEIRPMFDAINATPRQEIFLSPKGGRMNAKNIDLMINRYMRDIPGLRYRSAHVFRHSYATHMINRGAGIMEVQALLGHESASTTVRYTQVSLEHLKEVYRDCFQGERHSPRKPLTKLQPGISRSA